MPVRFETAGGPAQFCGLLADIERGRATRLERIFLRDT
jgi:calcineurin-like phosphoesterase